MHRQAFEPKRVGLRSSNRAGLGVRLWESPSQDRTRAVSPARSFRSGAPAQARLNLRPQIGNELLNRPRAQIALRPVPDGNRPRLRFLAA